MNLLELRFQLQSRTRFKSESPRIGLPWVIWASLWAKRAIVSLKDASNGFEPVEQAKHREIDLKAVWRDDDGRGKLIQTEPILNSRSYAGGGLIGVSYMSGRFMRKCTTDLIFF